jgi:hypothetical protein
MDPSAIAHVAFGIGFEHLHPHHPEVVGTPVDIGSKLFACACEYAVAHLVTARHGGFYGLGLV